MNASDQPPCMSVGSREATEPAAGPPGFVAKAARTMKDRDTLIEQSGNYCNGAIYYNFAQVIQFHPNPFVDY